MRLLLVSVWLAIFSSSLTSASDPEYIITVPVNLAQGAEEKVCVSFLDLKGAVEIKLELKKDDQVHVVVEDKVEDAPHYSKCYQFQVPVIEEQLSIWLFHVTAHGDHVDVDESKKVVLLRKHYCVIQMDKPTYKPGDIVKFQLISVDHHLHATDDTFPLVEITDSNKQRIAQWLKVSTNHGFAGFSFPLADDISLGKYKINLPDLCSKDFTVEEYVLKRFEVIITAPSLVTLLDKSFHMEVCARYTYGKPVTGSIDVNICPKQFYHNSDPDTIDENQEYCVNIKNLKTDTNGCLSKDISIEQFNLSKSDEKQSFLIESTVKEELTGYTEKASAQVEINTRKTIQFFESMAIYQKGRPYHTRVKVTDEKNHPMPNTVIYIHGDTPSLTEKPQTSVTDENGVAHFALDTSTWESFIILRASFSPDEDEEVNDVLARARSWVGPSDTRSESHISIEKQSIITECNSDQTATVKYDIHRKNLNPETDHIHIYSLLRTKSGILSYTDHKIDIKDQADNPTVHGSFPINFHLDAEMFPVLLLLVFSVLPNGQVITNGEDFRTPICANEKVQLKFSEEQVHPGASVNLDISAKAGAYCSIRSVDKGYLLEKPHDRSLLLDFKNEFRSFDEIMYTIRTLAEDPVSNQCPENEIAIGADLAMSMHLDSYSLFTQIGLKVFTNTQFKSPPICIKSDFAARSATKLKKLGDKDKETEEHFTRRHLPDSWIFEVVPIDSDGHTVLSRTAPHSITNFVTDAICLSNTGFASVTGVELRVFQQYFIDLIVPYSVVQGEQFTIQAVVFSYAKKCSLIVIALPDSEDFKEVKKREQATCVCEGHSHRFTWDVRALKPKKLKVHVVSGSLEVDGECTVDPLLIKDDHREDSIEKSIVVKPRGLEAEMTQTFIIFPTEIKQDIHITLNHPKRLIPGSEYAHLIIQGDIIANIKVNVDSMVRMPEQCGEQNAAKFLRFVYVLDYFESINELTPENKATLVKGLEKTYQTQLTYRDDSGAYSFFPDDDRKNLWLTVLVVKALSKAQKWIYIDEKHIQESLKWLESLQQPDGCFGENGHHFNNKLQADNEASRTAFILISVLEQKETHGVTFVENALNCLRKSVDRDESAFTQALMAYAFTLAGESELRDKILKKLDEKAVTKEGKKDWPANPDDPDDHGDVETLAYILLALLSEKKPAAKNLEECAPLIHGLVAHQNPYGGFHSSQDTTLALQALALYSKAMNFKKGASTVTITSKLGFEKTIHVDESNSLLVQTVDLTEIPGEYTVSVVGEGVLYLQKHLHYSATPDHEDHFSLNVTSEPSSCTHESQKSFDLHIDVRYTGNRANTNMALILIEPPSGYIPNKDSVEKMAKLPDIRRIEVSAEKVSIYLDQFTHESRSFVLTLKQESHVENLQPATVMVTDYYFTEDHAEAEYHAPCSGVVAHCDVHAAERGDCGQPGITKEECEEKGCCYSTNVHAAKWCFFKGFKKI